MTVLALLSGLIWWVLYGSVGAVLPSVVAWVVLRWSEGAPVVFNRTYLACLVWALFSLLICMVKAASGIGAHPSLGALLGDTTFRNITAVASMLVGVLALWRLIPRVDARRIRIGSACMAVAVVMAITFGVVTTLATV